MADDVIDFGAFSLVFFQFPFDQFHGFCLSHFRSFSSTAKPLLCLIFSSPHIHSFLMLQTVQLDPYNLHTVFEYYQSRRLKGHCITNGEP